MVTRHIETRSDSYKYTHWKQYPKGTTKIWSYLESRGGKFDGTIFFGLQYLLKEFLAGAVVTREGIEKAAKYCKLHFGNEEYFNREGWEYILNKHGGKLPVRIKAVPEGTYVSTHNILMSIENTDPKCYWLTNFLETLLVQVWYPTTVATQSWHIKKLIGEFLEKTGDPAGLPFKLHDFGYRGVSSDESAMIGGMAHLVNFKGTDTFCALIAADEYYGCSSVAGYSIAAAEHSTITAWGEENEVEAYRNMLEQFPSGLVAVVSDSYDIFNACKNLWGDALKDRVMQREGTLVVRPDSGDPVETVEKVLEILGEAFGYTVNDKGFKVLDPHVRVIQGDGVNYDSIKAILQNLMDKGWSADNLAFGMGGALLQKLDRDVMLFAMKCAESVINGKIVNVFKKPVGDAWKASKKGRQVLVKTESGFETKPYGGSLQDELVTVFENGKIIKSYTFDEVCLRAGE
jgi:nicotinamide phosphoribosyltransferase